MNMTATPVRCLILASGNTLRGDDGVGPWLAEWAAHQYRQDARVCVITRQQWTPDLAADIAASHAVIFIDCSIAAAPGAIGLTLVEPAAAGSGLATHHMGAAQLLELARDLYNSEPDTALLLTLGASSIDLGEEFSDPVNAALPDACRMLEQLVNRLMRS